MKLSAFLLSFGWALLALAIGAASLGAESLDLQAEKTLVLWGGESGGQFGNAVAAGDFDGDGIDDLAVGAPAAGGTAGEPMAGRVYLFFGRAGRELAGGFRAAETADLVIVGAYSRHQIGMRLAAGDMDGDGRDDLAVGTMYGTGPDGHRAGCGEARVFFGRPRDELPERIDLAESEADITLYGAETHDRFAGEMAFGDLDGDGLQDLAIGAFYGDGPIGDRYHAGEVSLLFGDKRSRLPRVVDRASDRLPTIFGPEPTDTFGRAIATGDVDGDGREDLVVGAYYGDGPGNTRINAGETFLVFGRERSAFPEGLDLAEGGATILHGEEDGDVSGRSVSTADLDGDGLKDLLIGAHLSPCRSSAGSPGKCGAVYVVFGRTRASWPRALDLRTDADARIEAMAENDQLGWPIAGGRWGSEGDVALLFARGSDGGDLRRSKAGELFVLGRCSREDLARAETIRSAARFSLVGLDERDRIAADAVLLDWNGDGRPEIALGVPVAAGEKNLLPQCGEVAIWSRR
ncbi:MAG: FG-GAP repeat protein [Candidatus Eisenbacteria bacterium]|nr:FG-GAP repeat protein [Candidatus Eisenbacteria bacterium]